MEARRIQSIRTFRFRLALFVSTIVGLVALIGGMAFISWSSAQAVAKRFGAAELESFRLGGDFQLAVLRLDNALLRMGLEGNEAAAAEFTRESHRLKQWLVDQAPRLTSQRERQILAELSGVYELYLTAGQRVLTTSKEGTDEQLLESRTEFDRQAQRILGLGNKLAEAHRASFGEFLDDSDDSLRQLRNILLGSLAALTLVSAGLAVFVYRALVRPLETRLVEAQALAARHEKLGALGVLAAGVAHEIRNPLTAIKARIYTLQRRFAAQSPEREATDVIDGEIGRLERIVREFLHFARPPDPQFQPVDLGALLQEVQEFLAPVIERGGITFRVEPTSAIGVLADPQQLRQVFINLAQNAAEACQPGGRVTLRLALESGRREGRPMHWVIVEVEDTGCGIPVDLQPRLFDPFFTTKPTGTGLGLSIAARIVERHGGFMRYQSQPGLGTVFGVALPRAEDARPGGT